MPSTGIIRPCLRKWSEPHSRVRQRTAKSRAGAIASMHETAAGITS